MATVSIFPSVHAHLTTRGSEMPINGEAGVSAKELVTVNVLLRMSQGTSEPGVSWYKRVCRG